MMPKERRSTVDRADKYITVTKEGETWLMSPKLGGPISFIASSFNVNVENGKHIDFLMFKLPAETKGLMIVEVYLGRGEWAKCFILINAGSVQPFHLGEHIFIPKNGTVLNIINHHLEITCNDGKIFTSNSNDKTSGKRYVEANLLCQFAFGLIPQQAVIDAACDEVRETDAFAEAAELRKKLKYSAKKLDVAGNRIAELRESEKVLKDKLEKANDRISELDKSKNRLNDIALEILNAKPWKTVGQTNKRKLRTRIAEAYC